MDINTKTNTKCLTTKLVVTAMLVAVAFVLQYFEVSFPLVPSFIKLDFSDVPELIGSFAIGPMYGVIISAVKNILHLPFGSSMAVGELSNFILGAAFSFIAGMVYKYCKNRKGAAVGAILGALAMALISIPSNYFVVYPVYAQLWAGGDMNVIINMYKTILPLSDTLLKSLLIFNVPFTFVKGIIVAVITFIIYKPLSNVIYKMNTTFNKKKIDKTA